MEISGLEGLCIQCLISNDDLLYPCVCSGREAAPETLM